MKRRSLFTVILLIPILAKAQIDRTRLDNLFLCTLITKLFGGKEISASSLSFMKTIQDGYGKDLFSYGNASHAGFGHNGKTEGSGSSLQYYPETG